MAAATGKREAEAGIVLLISGLTSHLCLVSVCLTLHSTGRSLVLHRISRELQWHRGRVTRNGSGASYSIRQDQGGRPFYRGKTEALDRTMTCPTGFPQGSRFFLVP